MKHHPPTRPAFTLIEMLVVIAIIVLLIGLLMPAISGAFKKAKVARASSEAKAIAGAVRAYYTEYGRMPTNSATDVTYGATPPNSQLMNVLRSLNATGNGNYANNLRRIVFLEIPPKALDASGNFIDPWKTQYRIVIDSNYDGSPAVATVTSYGPNRASGGGDDIDE